MKTIILYNENHNRESTSHSLCLHGLAARLFSDGYLPC